MDPRLDEALHRARLGDPRAFRWIAETLGPPLVRFTTFLLGGDEHAAHDVVQDTLLLAWDALDDLRDGEHVRRWCYRVARCRAISWMRRAAPSGRRMNSLDAGFDGDDSGRSRVLPGRGDPRDDDDDGEDDELLARLERAMKTLPANYAAPIHLYYVQGLSTQETAHLLGLERGAVKMRLHRARRYLRRRLHRETLGTHPAPRSSSHPSPHPAPRPSPPPTPHPHRKASPGDIP